MTSYKSVFIILLIVIASSCKKDDAIHSDPAYSEELTKACQWIDGGGSATTGGMGGILYTVTSLDDENDRTSGLPKRGTLRYGVEQITGSRVIVFRVSGTIHLNKELGPLKIRQGNITIAGQTAPGDGICIADYPIDIKNVNNVIIRCIRVRLGNDYLKQYNNKDEAEDYDAISIYNSTNVVVDHCSFSWSVDECCSCYGNTNFSLQYCFITESLRNAGHVKGAHGYGGIWGGTNASFHHNLIAHHDSRNPRFDHEYVNRTCKGPIDFANNVVYNWGGNPAYGGEGVGEYRKINFVNNYYKPGPASKNKTRLIEPWTSCSNCSPLGKVVPPKIYLAGNYMFNSCAVTQDNWQGSTIKTDAVKAAARWTLNLTTLTHEQTAEDAYEIVLTKAGCSLHRDAIDMRIVGEVRNGNYTYQGSKGSTGGLIDCQEDVGGWPVLNQGEVPKDSDADGMPDDWETKYGLDSHDYKDANLYTLVKDHTNLDAYLNDIVKHLY